MSENMRAQVARANIHAKLAEGWQFVKGTSPDGKVWFGDAVLMEIDRETFDKIHKGRRESFDLMSKAMRVGHHPISSSGEEGVAIKHTREEVRPKGGRRQAE